MAHDEKNPKPDCIPLRDQKGTFAEASMNDRLVDGFEIGDILRISNRLIRAQEQVTSIIDRFRAGDSEVQIINNIIRFGVQLGTGNINSPEFLRKQFVIASQVGVPYNIPELVQSTDGVAQDVHNKITRSELNQNLYSPDAPFNDASSAEGGSSEAYASFSLRDLNSAFTSTKIEISKKTLAISKKQLSVKSDPVSNATFFRGSPNLKPGGQIPVKFEADSDDGSFIVNHATRPQDVGGMSDDDVYVPLSFTDLRPIGGSLRTVYFRPFITSLNEDYSPEWNKQSYYGRTDQVVSYISTIRNIFLGFELHAFAPEDLEMIYKKLHWLSSLVYPEYDSDFLIKSGPVARIRVGDVISSKNGLGLSGVIDSLSYDYSDSIWEVERDKKAPRTVKVSISFHVLHDTPMGRLTDGSFGGIEERIGLTDSTVSRDSNIRLSTEPFSNPSYLRKIGNK